MSSEMVIKVENLSKCYQIYNQPHDRLKQLIYRRLQRLVGKTPKQYFREFWALTDVSFEINKGETVGIIGRNGSGKSTLLQMVCGTLNPTSGNIQTTGRIAALLELGSGFNPDFTGRENVYLNGSVLGFSRAEMDANFEHIVSFADIGEHLDQPVKTYSSGMYVRLAFAVQACIKPQILIVDEALSVGDEKFQRKCFDYIDRLRSDGCSILLVTHSTATIEKFCQRAILLHKGELHGVGSAKEIVDQYHALLYSDEKAYLRYLHNQTVADNSAAVEGIDTPEELPVDTPVGQPIEDQSLRAVIKNWVILDQNENYSESFKTGDEVKIRFYADVLHPVSEIQAGILIRTVEGISAFGTSTLYHGNNYPNAIPGTLLQFDFNVNLSLCSGAYFVTLAIAEAISSGDMMYLDKKTDIIVFKINEMRILGSGIAALKSSISVQEVKKA